MTFNPIWFTLKAENRIDVYIVTRCRYHFALLKFSYLFCLYLSIYPQLLPPLFWSFHCLFTLCLSLLCILCVFGMICRYIFAAWILCNRNGTFMYAHFSQHEIFSKEVGCSNNSSWYKFYFILLVDVQEICILVCVCWEWKVF